MPISLKKILAGVMIAGDAFLFLVAIFLLAEPDMVGVSIFMMIFLVVDAYLSVDYIISLHHQEQALQDQQTEEKVASIRQEAEEEKTLAQRDAIDDALAEKIRQEKIDAHADVPDPDELQKMLDKDNLSGTGAEQKQ
jgi:hypothetical protein